MSAPTKPPHALWFAATFRIAMTSTVHNQKAELVMDGTQRYLVRKKPSGAAS